MWLKMGETGDDQMLAEERGGEERLPTQEPRLSEGQRPREGRRGAGRDPSPVKRDRKGRQVGT